MRSLQYLSPEWAAEAQKRLREQTESGNDENPILILTDGCEAMSKFPLAIEEI